MTWDNTWWFLLGFDAGIIVLGIAKMLGDYRRGV
jgi:hypothetical protein